MPERKQDEGGGDTEANAERRRLRRLFLGLTALAVVLWSVPFLWWLFSVPGTATHIEGMYEALNALFSGLAVVGLVATLVFYQHELKLQLDELGAAVAAQRDSADALKKGLKLEKQQTRQRLVFELLKEWHSPQMQLSRDSAERSFRQAEPAEGRPLPSLDCYGADPRETREVFHIFRVLHFFEKLADLRNARLVEPRLAARLLGEYLEFWDAHLFDLLRRMELEDIHVRKLVKVKRLAVEVRRLRLAGSVPVTRPEAPEPLTPA